MTETGTRNWQERQKLLHPRDGNPDPEQLAGLGREAMTRGHLQDAFEYFNASRNQAGLDRLQQIAVEEGDAFLLVSLEKAGTVISTDIWNSAGNKAFALGKYRFAKTAFERANNEAMLAKTAEASGGGDASQPA